LKPINNISFLLFGFPNFPFVSFRCCFSSYSFPIVFFDQYILLEGEKKVKKRKHKQKQDERAKSQIKSMQHKQSKIKFSKEYFQSEKKFAANEFFLSKWTS